MGEVVMVDECKECGSLGSQCCAPDCTIQRVEDEPVNLWVGYSCINTDRHCRFSDTEPYETGYTNIGNLYRAMREEFGKCISKVYRDTKTGTTEAIGWVFQKRMKYDGSKNTYIQETWVTVYDPPIPETDTYIGKPTVHRLK
jgi:hypothetical protein